MLAIPNVYLDESGNTGPDLGNLNQPVYAVASVLDDGSWSDLGVSAGDDELKWSALAAAPDGRERILEIVERVTPSRVKTAIADKRYMAVAKMVDDLIEPMAQATNFDLYGTNSHRGMTDMTYVALRWLAGNDGLDQVVRTFVKMMRDRDEPSIDSFYRSLEEVGDRGHEVDEHLSFIGLTEGFAYEEIRGASVEAFELDPCVPLVSSLAQAWTQELEVPHRFIHDTSGKLEQWQEHFSHFGRMDAVPKVIKFGDIEILVPVMTFEIQFKVSEEAPLIQIADVIAGATRYLAQRTLMNEPDELADALRATPISDLAVEALWFVPPDLETEALAG